ncbi:MAG: DUF4012 domain-containing protein, partial [Marmoricola sp.]
MLALLGVLVLVFAYQATRTALALRQARAEVAQVRAQVLRGDVADARRTAKELAEHASTAHDSSDGILFDVASKLPFVGDDVEAVQLISSSLDRLSQDALPVGLDLVSTVRAGRLQDDDGRFDLALIRRLAPKVSRAAASTAAAERALSPIDPDGLVSPVGKAAREVQERVAQLDSGVSSADAATRLLPDMLGGKGARNYLLVVQNNAEIRSTGGLPGSLSILRADDGRLQLGFRGSATDFPPLPRPVLPLTAGELDIYGPAMGKDVRDTNLTPDFPRTGQLLSAIVAQGRGQKLDGVVSVDPVALSQVLRATGPVKVGTETFNTSNVVAKLLNESYQRLPTQEAQNAYFASASQDIFNTLLSGRVSEQAVVRRLGEGVRQRRVLVWSRDSKEQQILESSGISGRLPRATGAAPHVGVYVNDAKGSKMEYFLRYRGDVKSLGCAANGSQTMQTSMSFTSQAPRGGAGLSDTVAGYSTPTTRGDMKLRVQIYAPMGGALTGLSVNGNRASVGVGVHDGRRVFVLPMVLKPGQRTTVDALFRSAPGQDQ